MAQDASTVAPPAAFARAPEAAAATAPAKAKRSPRRFILPLILIGAAAYGIHSRPALAAPEPVSMSRVETPPTVQFVQPRAASADDDYGPGQAEPILVNSP